MIQWLLKFYRFVISPALQVGFGIQCRYEESCSHYAERQIREHGVVRGGLRGLRRVVSCNPWGVFLNRSSHG